MMVVRRLCPCPTSAQPAGYYISHEIRNRFTGIGKAIFCYEHVVHTFLDKKFAVVL